MNDARANVLIQAKQQDEAMAEADDPWIDKDFESAVRDTAYFLWENDGRPLGREKEYWFAALDRCLRQREADALLQQEPRTDSDPDHREV